MITKDKYLRLLAKEYPTAAKTVTEIINLEAIMNLPKATEHFISDLHGEYDAVQHVLRNGSGNVKEKIREIFQGRLSTREMNQLATIVYYPEDKIDMIVDSLESEEIHALKSQKGDSGRLCLHHRRAAVQRYDHDK